ncbi:DMT family transporter [Halobacillus naozhouensis]|uniref:DMT family transporter n=1 Tax=Halobacillus naozhouensis TaxID=554880 RepID=A0ABY8J1H3_9BACI|nr:DMT family transporter [Halobacillus naozhouensis]WFT76348.1 DMT family transporter [Halobacillus naozhouensis]
MVLVVIIYAGNILTGKAINDLPPFTIAFFRLLIAFLILFPIGYKAAWKYRLTFRENKLPFLIMTLAGITFFNTFIYSALQFTTATNVSVLESVIPVVTVILSAFLLKEKLNFVQWLGIILSFLGAVWVVLDGRVFQLTSMTWNIGDGIMAGAILSWAVYSIYVKRYMHLFPSFAALLLMTGISVILLIPVVLIEWWVTGVPSFERSSHVIGLLYLGIFPSFIALILYNRAVDALGPSQASVFLNFLPVVTMLGAYFWLEETITVMQIIGALIVIGGVILTTQFNKLGRRKADHQKQNSNVSV